jgi:peptidoglycan hydrolase-like protein with peptidoglycan-binding domain
MAGYYTVSQGEHVPGIAASNGFTDYNTIWNHPNNADLKSKRQNPNVLFPGDSLYIPDRQQGEYARPTDKRHPFVKKGKPLKLRLTLQDQYEKPIANADCLLTVDADSHRLKSDANGKIEVDIPPTASKSQLLIQDSDQTPYGGIAIPIKIGELDPVEEISGQQGRLSGLGYFWEDIDGNTSADFESAVEEFQCDNGLTVDGICGPMTQAKMKQVYGC